MSLGLGVAAAVVVRGLPSRPGAPRPGRGAARGRSDRQPPVRRPRPSTGGAGCTREHGTGWTTPRPRPASRRRRSGRTARRPCASRRTRRAAWAGPRWPGVGWVESQHGTLDGRTPRRRRPAERPDRRPGARRVGRRGRRPGASGAVAAGDRPAPVHPLDLGSGGPPTATATASPTRRTSTTRPTQPRATSARPAATSPPGRAGRRRCSPTTTPTPTSARSTTPRRPTPTARLADRGRHPTEPVLAGPLPSNPMFGTLEEASPRRPVPRATGEGGDGRRTSPRASHSHVPRSTSSSDATSTP